MDHTRLISVKNLLSVMHNLIFLQSQSMMHVLSLGQIYTKMGEKLLLSSSQYVVPVEK